ncbi:MAG: hypothetical protein RLY31_2235 [Bacteroidota bacterium]|jgi:hypothetical protein
MKRNAILSILSLTTGFILPAQSYFLDVAIPSGVDHYYLGVSGGGVSFCDFNGDGLDDITLATGPGETLRFYRNTGSGFQKLLPFVPHIQEAKQILWIDYDNDGDKDLFVATYNGSNRLYRNLGNLTFADVTLSAGLPVTNFQTFGACWGDYNRDGWLDLYFGERKFAQTGLPNQNRLFQGNGDGTFSETTLLAGAADPGKIPMCSGFLDFDNDRWPDLYTAGDKLSGNTLLRNNGDGTFSDIGNLAGANLVMDGMSVTVGDYDRDGWQDIYISDIENGNALLHNLGWDADLGTATFEEIAGPAGVGFYGVGWSAQFLDADNDGDPDLYVSGSLIGTQQPSSAFYENEGNGTFSNPTAGFQGDTVSSYNNAVGDFNNDGFPDIMVVNTAPFKSQLWRNTGGPFHWLKIDLQGVLSNRDAIGAKVELFSALGYQQHYLQCGAGFLGQNSNTILFGLGNLPSADSLRITWPSGHVDRLPDVAANQRLLILEGSTTNGSILVDEDVNLLVSARNPDLPPPATCHVLPNPSRRTLRVVLPPTTHVPPFRYTIFDSSGTSVAEGSFSGQPFLIDVSRLPAGPYWLLVRNNAGHRWTTPWIKAAD